MSAFALCRDARGDAAVRATLERCLSLLRERLDRRLVGLILTGSFSRGEGSVLPVNGHLRVLGDVEFLVVVPHGRDYRTHRPVLDHWSHDATVAACGASRDGSCRARRHCRARTSWRRARPRRRRA